MYYKACAPNGNMERVELDLVNREQSGINKETSGEAPESFHLFRSESQPTV